MTAFIAALPMYDWPEARAETDAAWARMSAALRASGIDAPEELVRRNADMPAVTGGIRDASGVVIAQDPASLPPDELDLHTLWQHPSLLLAQTCWGPMELGLSRHVVVVGQPSYGGVEGGQGELYSSVILMRRDVDRNKEGKSSYSCPPPSVLPDISPSRGEISRSPTSKLLISPLEGEMSGRTEGGVKAPANGHALIPLDLLREKRFAYNGSDSMSGIIALTRDLEAVGEGIGIFGQKIVTGAHRASLVAVAQGRADVCAIDCRSWHMAKRFEPRAAELAAVGWTARRKGLPLITSAHTPAETVEKLRRVLAGF